MQISPLHIKLGMDESELAIAGPPVLAGDSVENLFTEAKSVGQQGSLALYRADDWLLGVASLSLGAGLEAATHRVYNDIFQATPGRHLARIWNYIPAINEPGPAGLENYRLFCRARSLAFEQHHGPGFKSQLPSASAVGAKSANLTVIFAASSNQPRHVENPLQVAAYNYPDQHGPRAPSFARATVVPGLTRQTVFISGTAAIRGHATIAPQSLTDQLACTMENLREISTACGLGPGLDRGGNSTRHFKVYLRHAADQSRVATILQEELLTANDQVSYLHADICRASLLVEIEVTLLGVAVLGAPAR